MDRFIKTGHVITNLRPDLLDSLGRNFNDNCQLKETTRVSTGKWHSIHVLFDFYIFFSCFSIGTVWKL